MKALNTLQTVMKVLQILALITSVFLCIGIGGCLVGGVVLLLLSGIEADFITDILISTGAENTFLLGAALLGEAIYLFAALTVMFSSYRYLKYEVSEGTPFTYSGADMLFRLSMIQLFVPLGGLFIVSLINALTGAGGIIQNEYDATIGLVCLLSSVACKYGASLRE